MVILTYHEILIYVKDSQHELMTDPVTPPEAPQHFAGGMLDLFADYYNYRNIDPNERIFNIFVPKSMTNEFIEHKNSIHINIVSEDEAIKYNFVIISRNELLPNRGLADRRFFSIFPRKLEILGKHINRLYNLGSTPELTEVCLLDNNFSIILFNDSHKEFHIRVNFIWSWFNIQYLKNMKKKGYIERKLQLTLYNKSKISNLQLESLWGGN